MTSSSPICVALRSSFFRWGTLYRCLASTLIPWPSGLPDNRSKRNLSTYVKAVASKWHSWFSIPTWRTSSLDSRGTWWRVFSKLTSSLVRPQISLSLTYDRECVRVCSDVFLVNCKELQTSWLCDTWSGSWREGFGADINDVSSSMNFGLVRLMNTRRVKQNTNRFPTFFMTNSLRLRSLYLHVFMDFTSP